MNIITFYSETGISDIFCPTGGMASNICAVISTLVSQQEGSTPPSDWTLSVWSLHAFQVVWLPHTVQKQPSGGIWLIGDSKLPIAVNVSVTELAL